MEDQKKHQQTNFRIPEIKLVYHNRVKAINRKKIISSRDAYRILKSVWDMSQIELREELKLILLDAKLRVMGVANIAVGSITSVDIDRRLIFGAALKARATGFILAHNHTSGVTEASATDIEATKQMVACAEMLDIDLIDHLIISKDRYYSLADNEQL